METWFEKDSPDHMVAWDAVPIPEWARRFRPRVIFDLGCALGGALVSILDRFGQWGCLGDLEQVVMFDKDPNLHHQGVSGWQEAVKRRVAACLGQFQGTQAVVIPRLETLGIASEGLAPLAGHYPPADLVVASHITYFFGDGSGRELVEAVLARHLRPTGLLWVNIRDMDCPVYRKRQEVYAAMGVEDPQPRDFSEYFADCVLPELRGARLIDQGRIAVNSRPGTDRTKVAELLMWRAFLDDSIEDVEPLRTAAREVGAAPGALYGETQFIIAPAGRDTRSGAL